MKKRVCIAIMIFCAVGLCANAWAAPPECDGFPNGNCAIGGNIGLNGQIFGHVMYNPPRFGAQLEAFGQANMRFNVGDVTIHDTDFDNKTVTRRWPLAFVTLSDPALPDLQFSFRTFAPMGRDDTFTTSLPALMAEVTVENTSDKPQTVNMALTTDKLLSDPVQYIATPLVHGVHNRNIFTGWTMPSKGIGKDKLGWISLTVAPHGRETARFLLTRFEEEGYVARKLHCPVEIADYVAKNWASIARATQEIDELLPATGDRKVDEYARWYMSCAPLMTKTRKDGNIINMGYSELNQRDSFWTSWIQLVYWPSMDKAMITQSAENQREDGKIPTTILPLIERNDDIDITTYFIHRIIRYSNFHRDMDFAKEMFPPMMKAFGWLYSLDDDGSGLPMQHSFWGDWKDVSGMEGRKYSPYAAMLYIAALRDASKLCNRIGEKETAADLMARYHKALALLNKPISQGGLFNGKYYQQVWYDGRNTLQVMQDQVVGIVFDVVEPEVADSILKALDGNMTKYGPAETYPYFPKDNFPYEPGDYHNGGVWPYMSHIHAWALIKRGQVDKAFDLIRTVGYYDLEKNGDYLPHEYVHSITGRNGGPRIQGWNASIFGTVYFGLQENQLDNNRKAFFGLF